MIWLKTQKYEESSRRKPIKRQSRPVLKLTDISSEGDRISVFKSIHLIIFNNLHNFVIFLLIILFILHLFRRNFK